MIEDWDDGEYCGEYCKVEDVDAMANTDKAVLIFIEGERFWVPFSLIHPESEVKVKGDAGDLIVARWFARKEGFEP